MFTHFTELRTGCVSLKPWVTVLYPLQRTDFKGTINCRSHNEQNEDKQDIMKMRIKFSSKCLKRRKTGYVKATKESCQMYDLTSTSNATRAGSMDHETPATSLSPGTDCYCPHPGLNCPWLSAMSQLLRETPKRCWKQWANISEVMRN